MYIGAEGYNLHSSTNIIDPLIGEKLPSLMNHDFGTTEQINVGAYSKKHQKTVAFQPFMV